MEPNYNLESSKRKGSWQKTKSTKWEKAFANDTTEKWLISNVYEQFIQLNIKSNRIKNGYGARSVTSVMSNPKTHWL